MRLAAGAAAFGDAVPTGRSGSLVWAALEIQPIVIGTAGHIDHGKSSLVQALTGIDPDRLVEEKERGLTIDLGFAPLELPDGRDVSIVDVPGHERFIKNMVAGASGIDLVVLVVAADDGVMPQTREHLDIMRLLGLQRGLIALTKIDLVEPELAELAAQEVRETVAGTFLAEAPLVPVSARTGMGIEELRRELCAAAVAAAPRSDAGVFRMPVQRVFSAPGFGTIVTGIPVSGAVVAGDVLEVVPGALRGKVRGLQAYGQKTDRARAGHSTAINLADVERRAVRRGSVLCAPGFFQAVRMFAGRFQALASLARPLADRLHVRVHIGTAEVLGELVLLDVETLAPGGTALVQLRLAEGVVCAPGDHFVVRLASPLLTLGGGVVVEESRHRLKRFKRFVLEELELQEQGLASLEGLTRTVLQRAGRAARSAAELAHDVKRSVAEVRELCGRLVEQGAARPFGADRWIAAEAWQAAVAELVASLEAWFGEHPHRAFAPVLELRQRCGWEGSFLALALEAAALEGRVVVEPGGKVRLPGREAGLDPRERELASAVAARLAAAGFQPPSKAELAAELGVAPTALGPVLEHLVDTGELVAFSSELYLPAAQLAAAEAAVVANCRQHGSLSIPELRDALQTSRKYLIPLLELLDARGVTLRQGGNRVLKSR